jgi:hypothetical protein
MRWNSEKAWKLGAMGITSMALTGHARAESINTLIAPLVGETAEVFGSDDGRQELIKGAGNTQANTIEVGDSHHGIFYIDQLFVHSLPSDVLVATSLEHSAGNSELTGEFQVKVLSKADLTPADLSDHLFLYEFGVDSAFDTDGFGTVIRLYEDASPGTTHFDLDDANDNDSSGSPSKAGGVVSVVDGAFYMGLGFKSVGNTWIAVGDDRINLPFSPVARIGDTGFALDRTESGIASIVGLSPLVDPFSGGLGEVIGSSQIGPKIPGSPWELSSNNQFQFNVVPEPATLGLIGLGVMTLWPRRKQA